MNSRSLLLLIVALGVAAFTAFAVKSRLQQAEVAAPQVAEQAKVLVASVAIPAGSFIRSDAHLAFVAWPADTIQQNYITQAGHTVDEFNGAVVRRAINAGEPITANLLVKTSEGGFMSAVLQGGMRAVSIAVNATSGNAGFVFPGDRVDLIVTHSIPVQAGNGQTAQNIVVSETFIENVRVLAIDQMLDNPENKAVLAKTVTLEVTPKEAEKVNVAGDLGKISLSLRSLANEKRVAAGEEMNPALTPLVEADTSNTKPANIEDTGPESNMTRDSEVSRLLMNGVAPGTPVNVIRGNASEKIQFGATGAANSSSSQVPLGGTAR